MKAMGWILALLIGISTVFVWQYLAVQVKNQTKLTDQRLVQLEDAHERRLAELNAVHMKRAGQLDRMRAQLETTRQKEGELDVDRQEAELARMAQDLAFYQQYLPQTGAMVEALR